jgi:Flp pilus assembly protein TadD
MSLSPEKESTSVRAFVLVLLASALVVALQLAGVTHPTPGSWGLHHYGYLPSGWLTAGIVGALLLFLIGWSRGAGFRALRLPAAATATILAVAGAVLFWVGRERAFFLGDGEFWIRGLSVGRYPWHAEPAAVFANVGVYRLFGSPNPALTFAGVSAACGVGYLLGAFLFARRVAASTWGQALIVGLLALAGLTRLFYGYVETYPVLALVVTWFLVLTAGYLAGRDGIWGPVVLASIAPLVNVTAVLLLPALAYALWRGPKPAEDEPPTGARGRRMLGLLPPILVIAAGVVFLGTVPGALADVAGRYFTGMLPLSGGGSHVPYTLLSLRHLSDWFQEQMLLGPFGALFVILLLVFAARGRLGREGRFLLWAGFPWWVFSFFLSRETGAARSWDLFAVASIPFVMAVGLMLARVEWAAARPRLAGAMAGLVLGASFLHTLPWIAVDTVPERAMLHFASLYGPASPATPFARSYAFEQIAIWFTARGEHDNAVTAYREAVDADPGNTRAAESLAGILAGAGQPAEARTVLAEAAARNPDDAVLRFRLANARRALGEPDSAAVDYRRAISLNPGYLEAYVTLAAMERDRGNFGTADSVLTEAKRLFPGNGDVRANIGQLRVAQKEYPSAVDAYKEAVKLNPDDMNSTYNLGVLLMQMDRLEEAEGYLDTVVKRRPRDVEAWINLGSTHDVLGEPAAAEAAFRQAIDLAPKRPEPYFNLGRMYLASGDTAKAEAIISRYAAMDSTSEMGHLARRLIGAMRSRHAAGGGR